MPSIRLIVGLGNPGEKYIGTRHNAGADFVSALATQSSIDLKTEKKLSARVGRGSVAGHDVRLLIPDTYMNHSGKAVGLAVNYFQIPPEQLLIVHEPDRFVHALPEFGHALEHGGAHQ